MTRAHSDSPPTGVLAVNLGSPDAPTSHCVRRYLREFLSDPRVVDWPRIIWLPILHGIILPIRGPRSAALYQRVWTDDGAPLVATVGRQAADLADRLGEGWVVVPAMRYGSPSIPDGLAELLSRGCHRVVVLPLFPQFAEATTGSLVAAVESAAARSSPPPELVVVPPYPTDDGYLEALAAGVAETRAAHPRTDHVVFSFHGVPARVVTAGDPYQAHCEATAQALAGRLSLGPDDWSLVYQSRFGPERWLQPYAADAVPALARRGCRHVLVACPGFTADCLETLDEIGRELAQSFREAGGEQLILSPCLGERPDWIAALERLVRTAADTSQP